MSKYLMLLLLLAINNVKCQNRIIGGKNAEQGKWPFVVSIISKKQVFCGGTIISDHSILTAAHCFWDEDFEANGELDLWIFGGNINVESIAPEDKFQVKEIKMHESYNHTTKANDVAVLILKAKIPKNREYMSQLCLPEASSQVFGTDNCMVVGWGRTVENGKDFPFILQEVKIKLLPNQNCKLYKIFNPTKMICAGHEEGGKDACQGDSGGPLVCATKDNPDDYALEGIVSFGVGCGRKSYPGIYTRVSTYIDWIQKAADG